MNDQKLYDKLVARIEADQAGCWIWQGAVRALRDGNLGARGTAWHNGEYLQTHRAMWIARYGEIPDGLCVCHSCDTSLCLNPEHLWLGTHQQNMQDMRLKGRSSGASATHCKQGHPLSGDNLIQSLLVGKNPQRRCKICRTEYDRRTYIPSPPKPWLPKAEREARDAAIVEGRKQGLSMSELAEKFGMSAARCNQICIAAGLRTQLPPTARDGQS